ncbi:MULTISPECIES: RagB/SusD family nutrient uptake outer membrane protein, partial [Streptomyces]
PTITLLNDLGITLSGGNTTANFALNHVISSRSTDVRNLLFEPGTAGRGPIKTECTKYLGKNGTINLDNVPVYRIAEAYLIRAEAQATAGSPVLNLTNALADLKTIKSNRYVGYTGSSLE